MNDTFRKYLNDNKSLAVNISQIDYALKNKTCCFITAYQSTLSEKENEVMFKQLSKDLRAVGYGHTNLRGVYQSIPERSMLIAMPAY